MRRVFLSVAAAALLVLAFGLSIAATSLWCARASQAEPASDQSNSGQKYEVSIDNFSFGPATLTVPVGAKVTWVNRDDVPHNVVSTDGKDIKSPVLDTDQNFTYTFAKAGTYAYYCSIHPKMTGKVMVQ